MIEIKSREVPGRKVRWDVHVVHEWSSVTSRNKKQGGPTRSGNSEPALAATPFALAGTKGATTMASLLATSVTGHPRAGRGSLITAAEELLLTSRHLAERAESTRVAAVDGARKLGMSWEEIADLLGTTAEAARAAQRRAATR